MLIFPTDSDSNLLGEFDSCLVFGLEVRILNVSKQHKKFRTFDLLDVYNIFVHCVKQTNS